MKGWLHWRLLGALIKGDARAANSRRIVAPSSSLRPLSFHRAAPAPLCSARAIDLIQSQSLTHQPCPSAPVHHVLSSTSQRSRRAPKRKWVWRLETCDGALVLAPPHSAAGPRGPAANARGYAKADSCPPPAASDCAARYQRGSAMLPLTVQPMW